MQAHKLLREAMVRLHVEAFKDWYQSIDGDKQVISDVDNDLQEFCNEINDDNVPATPKLLMRSITKLEELINEFDQEREFSPSHVMWKLYIKMVNILIRFTSSYRRDDWERLYMKPELFCHISSSQVIITIVILSHYTSVSCMI